MGSYLLTCFHPSAFKPDALSAYMRRLVDHRPGLSPLVPLLSGNGHGKIIPLPASHGLFTLKSCQRKLYDSCLNETAVTPTAHVLLSI